MSNESPKLTILINSWSLTNETDSAGKPLSIPDQIREVQKAGFDAFCCSADREGLKQALAETGLRYAAAFDAGSVEEAEKKIQLGLSIDNGPMNCQLGDHDTPVEKAIEMTIGLMEVAEKLGADVHLEMHRDTCTETPEKTYAIVEGVTKARGKAPKVNFDFSHPGSLKHLNAGNYIERLFEDIPLFQQSTLWHMRPFNGHHCQVPVTDGKGNFSPEYEEMRPFIRQGLQYWLEGQRPGNELWVCPEIGPKFGYGLSCFPDSWQDAIVLGNDIRAIWSELLP